MRNQRRDFHHQAARALVNRFGTVVLEDLKITNMTKAPEPKPDPEQEGAYLPNGAAAKAGLNTSILDAGWGQFQALCVAASYSKYSPSPRSSVVVGFTLPKRIADRQAVAEGGRRREGADACRPDRGDREAEAGDGHRERVEVDAGGWSQGPAVRALRVSTPGFRCPGWTSRSKAPSRKSPSRRRGRSA